VKAAAGGLLLLAGAAAPALGQAIEADRPGLLFAGSVLDRGRIQIELGAPQLAWSADRGQETRLVSFPSFLRVGLGHGLEVQVGHSLVNHLSETGQGRSRSETGFGDLSVALKIARAGARARPGLVVVASVGLPTGEGPFTSGDPLLGLQAQAVWSIGGGLSVGALAGYSRAAGGGSDATSGTLALSLGAAIDSSWAVYAEAAYCPRFERTADTAHIGGGVTRIIGERVQFDEFVNCGLNDATADWTAGTGIAVRF